jgi:hypothetical protein
MLFTCGNTPIPGYFDQEILPSIESDASDIAFGAVFSQKFEDGKIHPCILLSKKFYPAEFNYEVFNKEMLAIVYALQKWRHAVFGMPKKTTGFSDHQNLEYFTTKVKLNKRQARWGKIPLEFDFIIVYRNGSFDQEVDIVFRSLVYTFIERGTTAIAENPMLGPEQ